MINIKLERFELVHDLLSEPPISYKIELLDYSTFTFSSSENEPKIYPIKKIIKLINFIKINQITDYINDRVLDGNSIKILYKLNEQNERKIELINLEYSDDKIHKKFNSIYMKTLKDL